MTGLATGGQRFPLFRAGIGGVGGETGKMLSLRPVAGAFEEVVRNCRYVDCFGLARLVPTAARPPAAGFASCGTAVHHRVSASGVVLSVAPVGVAAVAAGLAAAPPARRVRLRVAGGGFFFGLDWQTHRGTGGEKKDSESLRKAPHLRHGHSPESRPASRPCNDLRFECGLLPSLPKTCQAGHGRATCIAGRGRLNVSAIAYRPGAAGAAPDATGMAPVAFTAGGRRRRDRS